MTGAANGSPIWEQGGNGQSSPKSSIGTVRYWEPGARPAESCRWTPLPMLQCGRSEGGREDWDLGAGLAQVRHRARLCVIGRYCSTPAVQGYGAWRRRNWDTNSSEGEDRLAHRIKRGCRVPLLLLLLLHAAILFAGAAFPVKCLSRAIRRPSNSSNPATPSSLLHRPNKPLTLEPPGRLPCRRAGFYSVRLAERPPVDQAHLSSGFNLELQTSHPFPDSSLLDNSANRLVSPLDALGLGPHTTPAPP